MSKDIIVLAPNGRRQKVHCTPDTSMLQVLEDVCAKQGFQPTEYDLKHHNHIVDLTTTLRFTNLPNKATLEMVEAEKKREETNITIGLLLEDGERKTADFPPNTSLFDLVQSLAPIELSSFQHPTILYMRQEVIGVPALRGKTLRQLGLIKGRAILRLLNRPEEVNQANVSAVYRKPPSSKSIDKSDDDRPLFIDDEPSLPGPSSIHKDEKKSFDPVNLFKEAKHSPTPEDKVQKETAIKESVSDDTNIIVPMDLDKSQPLNAKNSMILFDQENLERRLRIEEEVTFLGAKKAVAFMQPEDMEHFEDLPDDFYELTVEEVRKLYQELQKNRLELENTPLQTSSARTSFEKQTLEQRMSGYKNAVVRVQFPDHMILQGIFLPSNTIGDIIDFIKEHLRNPDKPFHIFTTPLKEKLDPKKTLLESNFVPCVHMHFKWLEEDGENTCLKEEVYLKQTSSDAACILASKYRAPTRRKSDTSQGSNQPPGTSEIKRTSKVPRWFKN